MQQVDGGIESDLSINQKSKTETETHCQIKSCCAHQKYTNVSETGQIDSGLFVLG